MRIKVGNLRLVIAIIAVCIAGIIGSNMSAKTVEAAVYKAENGDFYYDVNADNTVSITGYIGSAATLAIPQTIDGKKVTMIGTGAFSSQKSLNSVTIPEGVKSIGKYAFWCCNSLTSVTLSKSVVTIEMGAFSNCSSLTNITIPKGVKSIGDNAFFECNRLSRITIPSSVKSIGASAFWNCSSLIGITIPNSVKSIGKYAFYKNKKLTKVTIGKNVKTIGESAFSGCTKLKTVTIHSTALTKIGDCAFMGDKKLTKITLKTTKLNKKSIGISALKGTNKKLVIKAPKKKVSAYKKYFKGKGNKTIKVQK